MKYHTLSTSSLASEGKKSTLTIYTEPDFLNEKMGLTTEEAIIRCELEMAQRALKFQTRRCRQLVAEFTRKLQAKDSQFLSERQLRDEQLSRVLRSLLVFESRLKQEQKLLRHELMERDETITRQKKEIRKLRFTIQFCKNCSQFCQDSCDSCSEFQDWETNSEVYGSVGESYIPENSSSGSETEKKERKISFEKNKNSENYKRPKKLNIPRRTTGTYFEVLKLRESDQESDLAEPETFSNRMDTLHGIRKTPSPSEEGEKVKISDTITVFDQGEEEHNNWYASASDAEDETQRDIYRNNPVLECMNQILLQNINDTNNTPPQSPELDRNPKSKTQKRVKFSDENDDKTSVSYVDAIEPKKDDQDYYETPIQVNNNFYETPQSIYSNDYEQILSKCGSDTSWPKKENLQENKINRMTTKMSIAKNSIDVDNKHYYIDMDTKTPSPTPREILKKTKLQRTPPALPPKPANLVSKFKIQTTSKSCENLDSFSVESEPDYCSISELNLPPQKIPHKESIYDPIEASEVNLQAPKSPHKAERVASISQISMLKNKKEPDIPKLPQVSEIIIPEESDDSSKNEHICQDNYIKNNSSLLKQRLSQSEKRGPIIISSSVSSLISGFNNHLLTEIGTRKPKNLFFDRSQSYEKPKIDPPNFEKFDLSQNFEEFNLDDCEIGEDYQSEPESYQEESIPLDPIPPKVDPIPPKPAQEPLIEPLTPEIKPNTSVEIVRATKTIQSPQSIQSLQQLQKNLNCQRHLNDPPKTTPPPQNPEPSYEHFLECTGLSSKSILTPSRMLSNHKSMLKPKDIKLRSKFKSAVFEHSGGTIKYWSEPYL